MLFLGCLDYFDIYWIFQWILTMNGCIIVIDQGNSPEDRKHKESGNGNSETHKTR